MEHGEISSELKIEKKILKLNFIIIMKKCNNFRVLSGDRNGLTTLSDYYYYYYYIFDEEPVEFLVFVGQQKWTSTA